MRSVDGPGSRPSSKSDNVSLLLFLLICVDSLTIAGDIQSDRLMKLNVQVCIASVVVIAVTYLSPGDCAER